MTGASGTKPEGEPVSMRPVAQTGRRIEQRIARMPATADDIVATTCYMCACRCGIRVHLKDGQPVYIDGNRDHPVNHGVLCAKGAAGLKNHFSPARRVPREGTPLAVVASRRSRALRLHVERRQARRARGGIRSPGRRLRGEWRVPPGDGNGSFPGPSGAPGDHHRRPCRHGLPGGAGRYPCPRR